MCFSILNFENKLEKGLNRLMKMLTCFSQSLLKTFLKLQKLPSKPSSCFKCDPKLDCFYSKYIFFVFQVITSKPVFVVASQIRCKNQLETPNEVSAQESRCAYCVRSQHRTLRKRRLVVFHYNLHLASL